MFQFFLISFYLLAGVSSTSYTFENTTDNAGIIFVPRDKIQLTYDEWHLCFFYDLTEFYDGLGKLKANVEDLSSLCNEPLMAKDHGVAGHICDSIHDQFANHLQTLQVRTDIIRSFRAQKRERRGAPLKFVGGIMSSLFGTMDAKDAERYNGLIDRLRGNAAYQNELIRLQTTLVESSIQTQNLTLHEMRTRMDELRSDIVLLKTKWFEDGEELYVRSHFSMFAQYTTLAILNHLDMAETIIRMLTQGSHGRIVDFMPADRLKQHLFDIQKSMPQDRELPIDIDRENVFQLLFTSTLRSTLAGDRIFFEISFPLLSPTRYVLYESVSVPAPMNDRYAIIVPRSEHFLTNDELSLYVPIRGHEVRDCLSVQGQHRLICSVAAPIQNNVQNICEIQLLRNPELNVLPADCNLQEVPRRNYVVRLPKSNTYFACVIEPMLFRGVCQDHAENSVISGSGWITIQPGCTLTNDEFSLTAHTVHRTVDDRTIVPGLNLNKISLGALRRKEAQESQRPVFVENREDQFRALTDTAAEIRRRIETNESEAAREDAAHKRQSTNYGFFVVILSIMIFGAIYLYRKTAATPAEEPKERAEEMYESIKREEVDAAEEEPRQWCGINIVP